MDTNSSGLIRNPQKVRLSFIDYFKAIAMILVVFGHINFANGFVKVWIYSFHMPLFFFATGFTMSISTKSTLKEFFGIVWKYFQRLMFPFFLWAVVFAKFSVGNLLRIIYGSYSTISSSGSLTSLWFLPAMFLAVVFFQLSGLIFKNKFGLVVKLVLSVAFFLIGFMLPRLKIGYPWCLNIAFVATGFLFWGNIIKPLVLRFYRFLLSRKSKRLEYCLLLIALSAVGFGGTMLCNINIPENGYVLMGGAIYGNYLLFVVTSVFGIILTLSLGIFVELLNIRGICKCLSYIGQNTLCIFAVQKPIIACFKKVFEMIQFPSVISLLITAICTLVISCLINVFICKYFPVFVGKQSLFPFPMLKRIDSK